jgi:hypothetical protein
MDHVPVWPTFRLGNVTDDGLAETHQALWTRLVSVNWGQVPQARSRWPRTTPTSHRPIPAPTSTTSVQW